MFINVAEVSRTEDHKVNQKYESNDCFEFEEKELTATNSSQEKEQKTWYSEISQETAEDAKKLEISVFDVAAYVLKKIGTISTMKLQKLIYYCQAWSLVWDEKPLFKEQIEAWANGPVIRELFAYHRGMFHISSVPVGNPELLNDTQKETIDAVLNYYGDKPSQWLIDLTHMEEPWKRARAGLPISVRSNRVVKLDDIAEYYSSLPPET